MKRPPAFVYLTPRRVKRVVGGLALACVLVLIGAGAFWEFYWSLEVPWGEAPRIKYVLAQFNLASENVPAVWFSSMLLLMVAVASVLCFAADTDEERQLLRSGHPVRSGRMLKYGWLVFAFVFLSLSLDELGSLHERVTLAMALHNPLEGGALEWAFSLLLPLLTLMAFMLAFGWLHVRRVPGTFVLMAVGAGCFLSIPIQEYIEIDVMYRAAGEGWRRPTALLLLEEGTELFGALSFFAAALLYALRISGRQETPGIGGRHAISWSPGSRVAIVWAIAFVVLMGVAMGVVQTVMGGIEGDSGIPRNWFPSALAAFVVLLGLHMWDTARRQQRPYAFAYLLLAAASIAASVYVGGYLYAYTSWGALDGVRLGRSDIQARSY